MLPSTPGTNDAPGAPVRAARQRRQGLRTCAAALVVSFLGLGAAGSATSTGAAEAAHVPPVQPVVLVEAALVAPLTAVPRAYTRHQAATISSSAPLTAAVLDRRAAQRSSNLQDADRRIARTALAKAEQARSSSLSSASRAARHQAAKIKAERAARAAARRAAKQRAAERRAERLAEQRARDSRARERRAAARKARAAGSDSSAPITSGYHIAARFGDTGSWSRYHTGIDFSAPIGTTVRAAASGVVTHSGSGPAGWAGRYVTIRHENGTSTLYAHLASVSVHDGQEVRGGRRIGAVGMTGRTFGPHLHFEVYPAGVQPRNPYDAVNPAPWLRARGIRF